MRTKTYKCIVDEFREEDDGKIMESDKFTVLSAIAHFKEVWGDRLLQIYTMNDNEKRIEWERR